MDTSTNPGFVTRLQTWAMTPITNPMDMLSVVLTVILVATVSYGWVKVMQHITEA